MKLTARQEVDAPADTVFRALTDIERVETLARDRGAQVARMTDTRALVPGAAWRVDFVWRGKPRQMRVTAASVEPGQSAVLDAAGTTVQLRLRVEIEPLRAGRSRMLVALTVKPQTLTARIMVQSMKLVRGRLTDRLQTRLDAIARAIADRHRAAAPTRPGP